ncbi:MAG: hypothetical protein A3G81_17230 [Betaproteobacteria bacterium RIFCSPLOWO2_12_FULL_65_14]|nr:MAG: hypothetical protein A3G81_17230 [Betaproteobacteria bacterium RIFCSPLOWO2_12_FULL_65_14]
MGEEDLIMCAPEVILSASERANIRPLIRKREKLSQRWQASYKEKDRQALLDASKHISAVCELALARELGLKKYMVIEVVRKNGYQEKFQFLEVDLHKDFNNPRRWTWALLGRSLRKDGSLGEKECRVGIWYATIRRRQLDGRWVAIRPTELTTT